MLYSDTCGSYQPQMIGATQLPLANPSASTQLPYFVNTSFYQHPLNSSAQFNTPPHQRQLNYTSIDENGKYSSPTTSTYHSPPTMTAPNYGWQNTAAVLRPEPNVNASPMLPTTQQTFNDESLPCFDENKSPFVVSENKENIKFCSKNVNGSKIEHSEKQRTNFSKDQIIDEKRYRERRQKNNEAAKQSRSKRRERENVLKERVEALEAENKRLRHQLEELTQKFATSKK